MLGRIESGIYKLAGPAPSNLPSCVKQEMILILSSSMPTKLAIKHKQQAAY